jgi:flagellar hook-associated protein FlgK
MANEDFEKKMEFIIEQQAQLVVNNQKSDERLARLENLVTRFAQATVERINDLDEKFAALVDAQMRTEESLRNLMAVVDHYFSEGRNGKSEA